MSKLPSYSLMLIVFVALIHEHIAFTRIRNSFEEALSNCARYCKQPRLPPLPPSRTNNLEKCLILADHDSTTITLCQGNCLQRIYDLGKDSTCDCRSGKCISTPSTSSSTTTTVRPSNPTSTSSASPTSTTASTASASPTSTTASTASASTSTTSSTTSSSTTMTPASSTIR